MGPSSTKPSKLGSISVNTDPAATPLHNDNKIEQAKQLMQNIKTVVDKMKEEVATNPLIPNKLFNDLFLMLESMRQGINPDRIHVCYIVGNTGAGKSSLIKRICKDSECITISHTATAGTDDFQIVSAPEVNAIFVDTVGFGAKLDDSPLMKRFQTEIDTINIPDAILLVVTRDHLRNEKSLKDTIDSINRILKYLAKKRYNTQVPIICVLNKIDEYFSEELSNSEADTRAIKNHMQEALEKVNKYLKTPVTVCVATSTTKEYGIDQLQLNINAQSPLNAQIIEKDLDYMSQYRLRLANKIIATFSTASAAISIVPFVDIVVVTFLQEWMYRMLACLSTDPHRTPDTFKTIHRIQQVGSLFFRTGALFVGGVLQLSFVGYLIGSGVCVTAAATSTAALGWSCYFYFVGENSSQDLSNDS